MDSSIFDDYARMMTQLLIIIIVCSIALGMTLMWLWHHIHIVFQIHWL